MPDAPADFFETNSLKQLLRISDAAMDQAMGLAYQLYLNGRFDEADVICRGLIACDQRYWWPHSLHGSILRRLGRPREALTAVQEGLKHEPRQPKLLLMRAELLINLARAEADEVPASGPSVTTDPAMAATAEGRTPPGSAKAA